MEEKPLSLKHEYGFGIKYMITKQKRLVNGFVSLRSDPSIRSLLHFSIAKCPNDDASVYLHRFECLHESPRSSDLG